MFSDTHCHIFKEDYDVNIIFKELPNNNIKRIICNGYDLNTNIQVIEEIYDYNYVYGAIGIHPDNIEDYTPETIKYIKNNVTLKKVVAVGEIGLDYYHNKDNKAEQIKLFEEMLNIAESVSKPVIIHTREATMDTINILKNHNNKGIIHSFSGSYETALEYIKLGYKLGINGVVTFKNANLPSVLEKIGIENILIETDSPCLTPVPHRGELNEPKNVLFVAKKICEIKNITMEELATQLEANFHDIFDI